MVRKDLFISHDAVTQSLLSKLHLFVSLSREFSKYIKTFAAGFTLVRTVLHDVSAGYNWKQFGWKLKMSVRKKCKCGLEILKNIVENRASFTSEQVIVSYPREILFQPLWKRYSYVRESCHFPRCGNAMFLFETFFVCVLIFEIELKPARFVDSSVSARILLYSEIYDAGLTYIYNI